MSATLHTPGLLLRLALLLGTLAACSGSPVSTVDGAPDTDASADGGESDTDPLPDAQPVDDASPDDTTGDTQDVDTADTDAGDDVPDSTPDTASDGSDDPDDVALPDADTRDDAGTDATGEVDSGDDTGADAGDAGEETDAASDADDATDTPEDTDPECREGILCGPAAVCCRDGAECVADACVPACPSRIRCGDDGLTCCDAGDVCLVGACTTPIGECIDALDCPEDHFCEFTLGACLPQPSELTCEIVPDFADIRVAVEWSYTDAEIISIPVVGDINGDGLPEVVVNLTNRGGGWEAGEVLAMRGTTGEVLWTIPHEPSSNRWGSHGRSTLGLGDVDGDGLPDVVYASREASGSSRIVAVNGRGETLWVSHDGAGNPAGFDVENGAPTLANLDDDPEAEIVFGAALVNNDGRVVWNEGGQGGRLGSNDGYVGGIAAIADLDGDGIPEIVSGRNAWKLNNTADDLAGATVTPFWSAVGADGYPGIADFDLNGTPEVVLVASRSVRILEGATGELWCGVDPSGEACVADAALRTPAILIPGGASTNRGGPPTISDFDGDGRPEIGVAGGFAYTVYDIARPGEVIVQPPGATPPSPGRIYERWSQTTRDRSSNSTGSSVFDFQGDGAAEVVYADECYMRVYDGASGRIQLEIPSSSATIHEYPLVVDVDADNNSEILIVANNTTASSNCAIAGYTPRRGLFVYGDPGDGWVRTRRVWTQHAYHVTNATSEGNVPFVADDAWRLPGLNAFRQNVLSEGAFNAPDLQVGLTLDRSYCPLVELGLVATVSNLGTLGVPAGVDVAFFNETTTPPTLLGTASTATALLPGGAVDVTLVVPLPPRGERSFAVVVDGDAAARVLECDESNNAASEAMDDCFGY